MFMQGMGMMGQAAMGQFQAMRQNVSNLLDTTPQKATQVVQQRNGFSGAGGGGAMNIDPNINMLPPAGMTGRGGYFGPDGGYGGGGGAAGAAIPFFGGVD